MLDRQGKDKEDGLYGTYHFNFILRISRYEMFVPRHQDDFSISYHALNTPSGMEEMFSQNVPRGQGLDKLMFEKNLITQQ